MSGGAVCSCRPRSLQVIQRRQRRSAFDGYRVMPSDYSTVRCLWCGHVWRTKAAYVDQLPNAPDGWERHA